MKHYELLNIIKPTLDESEIASKVEFVKELLTTNGAEIKCVNEIGIRNLAYEIDKNQRGYYLSIYFQNEGKNLKEIERILRNNEEIMRTMIIKFENKKEINFWNTLSTPKKPVETAPKEEVAKVEETKEASSETKEA